MSSYRRDPKSNALLLNVDSHTQEHTNNMFLMKKFPLVITKLVEQNRRFREDIRQIKEFPTEVAQLRRMIDQNSRSTMETQRQIGGPSLAEEVKRLAAEIEELKKTVASLKPKKVKEKTNGSV